MHSENIKIESLPNIGYVMAKMPEDIFNGLKRAVDTVAQNFETATPYNSDLVGNIEKEYGLEVPSSFEQYLLELVAPHNREFKYSDTLLIFDKHVDLKLGDVWVNFQKKHEFNPPHIHGGIYSFVVWMQIPYSIEDERNAPASKQSCRPLAGCFEFIYLNVLGNSCSQRIAADKSAEGYVMLFPATLMHAVHPFYTSDEFRISVSGNLVPNI
jgi:hypothetical protein